MPPLSSSPYLHIPPYNTKDLSTKPSFPLERDLLLHVYVDQRQRRAIGPDGATGKQGSDTQACGDYYCDCCGSLLGAGVVLRREREGFAVIGAIDFGKKGSGISDRFNWVDQEEGWLRASLPPPEKKTEKEKDRML